MNPSYSFRRLLIAGAGALALGVMSPYVHARSGAAIMGLAGSSDMPCLSIWYGTLTNNCSRVISLDVPLILDSSGTYKSVTVTAHGQTSANNVGCRSEGLDRGTNLVWYNAGGAFTYLASFGASADIVLAPVYVPDAGQLLTNCQISPGGRVDVINWTE